MATSNALVANGATGDLEFRNSNGGNLNITNTSGSNITLSNTLASGDIDFYTNDTLRCVIDSNGLLELYNDFKVKGTKPNIVL